MADSLICFVAAASANDTALLAGELRRYGVAPLSREAVALPTATASTTSIIDLIAASNFMIAAAGSNAVPNPNIVFEIGIAVGMGKPVLQLIPKGAFPLALDARLFIAQIESFDAPSIAPWVAAFVQFLKEKQPANPTHAQTNPELADRSAYLAQLRDSEEISKEIKAALGAVHLQYKTDPRIGTGAYDLDLLTWLPDLPSEIGNPIGIQIKLHPRVGFPYPISAEFQSLLRKNGLRSVILCSPNLDKNFCWITPIGYVFGIRPSALIPAIKGRELSNLLRQLRNSAAHGIT